MNASTCLRRVFHSQDYKYGLNDPVCSLHCKKINMKLDILVPSVVTLDVSCQRDILCPWCHWQHRDSYTSLVMHTRRWDSKLMGSISRSEFVFYLFLSTCYSTHVQWNLNLPISLTRPREGLYLECFVFYVRVLIHVKQNFKTSLSITYHFTWSRLVALRPEMLTFVTNYHNGINTVLTGCELEKEHFVQSCSGLHTPPA